MEKKPTISDVKKQLSKINQMDDPLLEELANDTRKGVQLALKKWQNNYDKQLLLQEHKKTMLIPERQLKEEGYRFIAGIDEVGRGPLAGPIVAAAVILPEGIPALPINDSKKLSASLREELSELILGCAQVGIGIVENDLIDSINIYEATKVAMEKAIHALPIQPDALLIDAMKLKTTIKQVSLIKGDAHSYSIAAASIVAKVYRDTLMKDYAEIYPHYGFENNAGYGTKIHLEGLKEFGTTPIHRKSFEPIKTMVRENC